MNLPNQLTLLRLLLVPVFVVLLSIEHAAAYGAAYLVFTVATITDYLDGRIARARGLVTNFGKLLDPIADKVLIAAAFVMAMHLPELWVPGWTVIAILAREFVVTGMRSLAASEGLVIAANQWGKAKMVLQAAWVFIFYALAVAVRLADHFVEGGLPWLSTGVYYGACYAIAAVALFTLYTGFRYIVDNWAVLGLDPAS
jgi:CDP-diacylglycerol---glycerol-3-phosphate 3-phosphatidyltransferase